jgi:sec-independent protein translocase protein TatA
MNLGMPEILLLLFIALLFFGGRKLPELGKSLGQGIKNFKSSMADGEKEAEAQRQQPAPKPPATPTGE